MFHISNFGKFADGLKPFADINGYVPHPGDSLDKMAYGPGFHPEAWEEFRQQAVAATSEASHALQAWQETPRRGPGRPPGRFTSGNGNPKKSVRLEGDLLAWVESHPGGLLGVVQEAYNKRSLF